MRNLLFVRLVYDDAGDCLDFGPIERAIDFGILFAKTGRLFYSDLDERICCKLPTAGHQFT